MVDSRAYTAASEWRVKWQPVKRRDPSLVPGSATERAAFSKEVKLGGFRYAHDVINWKNIATCSFKKANH